MQRYQPAIAALAALGAALACAGPAAEQEAAPPVPPRETETLTYRSDAGGTFYTPWEPGDTLMLGVDGANLREEPSTGSKVLSLLPLGRSVIISAIASGTEHLIDRDNRWYRIESEGQQGYLFGALLTPVAIHTNLDGDSGLERLAVTFSPNFVPRVRVMEPYFDEKDDRVVTLDLPMRSGGRGGKLRAEVLPGQKTAWKVVHVELCGDDGCVSQLVAYLLPKPDSVGYLSSVEAKPGDVTFTADGFTVKGQADPYIAVRGLLSNGPCSDCDKLLVSRYETNKVVIDHQFPGERDAGPRLVCEAVGQIRDGWYEGKDLVSCSTGWTSISLVAHKDYWLLVSEDNGHMEGFIEEQGVSVYRGDRLDVVFDS